MAVRWKELSPEARKGVQDHVDIAGVVEELTGSGSFTMDAADMVSFATVHRYVTDPAATLSAVQFAAIEADGKLSGALDALLENRTIVQFPIQAAASTDGAIERRLHGYCVRVVASRAHPDRAYLQVSLEAAATNQPTCLIVQQAGNQPVKQALEPPVDGVTQVMVEKDSAIVRALNDIGSRVWLQ